jgi:iron complex outermembrane recepter protein
MKKLFGLSCFLLLANLNFAQAKKKINEILVVDSATNAPLQFATVFIANFIKSNRVTSEDGICFYTNLAVGNYDIICTCAGYINKKANVEINNANSRATIKLVAKPSVLEAIEIIATRAASNAPFAKTNISKAEIEKLNTGVDLPFLLNETPSTIVDANAGIGVGYTNIRIRGTDATRINVTLNGIPFNDAESHGTYFVDMPDFASSTSSIQIQRGVGTSTNGTGAFGASINLQTNEFIEKPYCEFNNSFGSFGTIKNTVKVGSGLLNKSFTFDARLSQIKSNGYIDRAASNLQSLYMSGAYIHEKTSVRFNIISGKEKTYQAWNGILETMLDTARTFNVSGTEKANSPYENETDNYNQTHYQFFVNHAINKNLSLNATLFYTQGLGYYENYLANQKYSKYFLNNVVVGGNTFSKSDMVRQLWLDNDFYGQLFSCRYKKNKIIFTLGGGFSHYKGKHFGKIIWANNGGIPNNYSYYNLTANKQDFNMYSKLQYSISNTLELFGDVQYRTVKHQMNGFRKNLGLVVDRQFSFFNPKIGISYTHNNWQSFFSVSVANKEPNRDDFEASASNQPKAENLIDFELGIEKRTKKYQLGATFYYMKYKNQLVLTGKINDVGAANRTNVDNSYRMGIELQGAYKIGKKIEVKANITLSENKINNFVEFIDNYDDPNGNQTLINHNNTNLVLSPSLISSNTITYFASKKLECSLIGKYVGNQYLDNTQAQNRQLKAYYTQDFRAIYTIKNKIGKSCSVIASVNNILNNLYSANGYSYGYISMGATQSDNYVFPMAGINFMVGVNIKF